MGDTAVLVVGMLNDHRDPDAGLLAPNVAEIIGPLADLVHRARERGDVDLVYVNDNCGEFTAAFSDLVASALNGAVGSGCFGAQRRGRIWCGRSS